MSPSHIRCATSVLTQPRPSHTARILHETFQGRHEQARSAPKKESLTDEESLGLCACC